MLPLDVFVNGRQSSDMEFRQEWHQGALTGSDLMDMALKANAEKMGVGCSCKRTLFRLFFDAPKKQLGGECMHCGKVKYFVLGEKAAAS